MKQKFKIGDKVRHKTGGVVMVVVAYEPKEGNEVTCEWMSNNECLQRSFHEDLLELYIKPDSDPFFSRKLFQ